MADFLKPLIGPINADQAKFVLHREEVATTPVDACVESLDGLITKLDFIELQGFRGKDVVTLHNQQQNVPYKLKIVIDFKKKSSDFSFSIEEGIHNVKPKLEALRFWTALAGGGTLRISRRDTGLRIIEQPVSPGVIPSQDPILLEIFEKLAAIQLKTQQPINAPSQFSAKVVEEIFSTFIKVDTGKGLYRANRITFPADVQLASNLLKYLGSGETGNLFHKTMDDQTVTLFGTEINLGISMLLMKEVSLDPSEATRLKKELAGAGAGARFTVPITILDNLIRVWYPKWLPEEQKQALPIADEGDLGSL